MEGDRKEIVLITGSSGCLGQHIIKLLQEHENSTIQEIRLYDMREFVNVLGYPENIRMVEHIGDIRNLKELCEAMEGVDCVIHAASHIDMRLLADFKRMTSINVDGTKSVIAACLQRNVSRLIYASTTDMVCGSEHIFYGTESTTPIPTSFMIGKYGESKCEAERIVLESNGLTCANERTILKTVSLRPTPFFGEHDGHFIINFLKYTKKTGGHYYRVKSLDERLQISYAGNVAWAFVKAKQKLAVDPTIAGEAFFITDDTPIIDIHELVAPFIRAKGYGISRSVVPYSIAWVIISIACFVVWFFNLLWRWDVDIPSVNVLNYICSTFFFNRSKATLRLDYQPIFSPEEAKQRSLPYYANAHVP